MTERETEQLKQLVVGRKRDGRNCYDPAAKRELIESSMRPGVSVARIALDHGINANLLRTWIRKYQRQQDLGVGMKPVAVRPAFVPVVPARAAAKSGPQRLVAQLPNGVRLEIESMGPDDLAAMLRQLSALPCSDSMPG
jgi:transposase-like protein